MNKNFRLVSTHDEPNPEDLQILTNGLLAHHKASGHPRKTDHQTILLKNDLNKTVGIVLISFLWNGMKIESLWIEESLRGEGWGKILMESAEAEGIKRGCDFAYTDTFTWQAPNFYKKIGYEEYGKLENFPEGNSLTYLKKNLK